MDINEKKYYFEKKIRFFYFSHTYKEMKTAWSAENAKETVERRQIYRHSFSDKDNDLIESTIVVEDKQYNLNDQDLSLTCITCSLEKDVAERITKLNIYKTELKLNGKDVIIKGQMM